MNFHNIESLSIVSTNILIISISSMVFFALILTILLARTIVTKQIILSAFLDIPEKTAKTLYNKCENFLLESTFAEEDEIRSLLDIDIAEK